MGFGFDVGDAFGDAWDRYGPQVIDAAGRAVTDWATEQLTGGGSSGGSSAPRTTQTGGAPPPAASSLLLPLGLALVAVLVLKGGL